MPRGCLFYACSPGGLLIGKQCCTQSAVILGQLAGVHLMAQACSQCLHYAAVLCHTTGHHHSVLHADAVGQAHNTVGNGTVNTGNDIVFVGSLCQLANHFAFGKHRTC